MEFFAPHCRVYRMGKAQELKAVSCETNWWSWHSSVWASLQLVIGTLGAELFLVRTAFLIADRWYIAVAVRHRNSAYSCVSVISTVS